MIQNDRKFCVNVMFTYHKKEEDINTIFFFLYWVYLESDSKSSQFLFSTETQQFIIHKHE